MPDGMSGGWIQKRGHLGNMFFCHAVTTILNQRRIQGTFRSLTSNTCIYKLSCPDKVRSYYRPWKLDPRSTNPGCSTSKSVECCRTGQRQVWFRNDLSRHAGRDSLETEHCNTDIAWYLLGITNEALSRCWCKGSNLVILHWHVGKYFIGIFRNMLARRCKLSFQGWHFWLRSDRSVCSYFLHRNWDCARLQLDHNASRARNHKALRHLTS